MVVSAQAVWMSKQCDWWSLHNLSPIRSVLVVLTGRDVELGGAINKQSSRRQKERSQASSAIYVIKTNEVKNKMNHFMISV